MDLSWQMHVIVLYIPSIYHITLPVGLHSVRLLHEINMKMYVIEIHVYHNLTLLCNSNKWWTKHMIIQVYSFKFLVMISAVIIYPSTYKLLFALNFEKKRNNIHVK